MALIMRYEYGAAENLGFCYFLGLCAQAGKEGEKEPEIFERLKRLPDVDSPTGAIQSTIYSCNGHTLSLHLRNVVVI